ncbi:MAG TPA: alpha/beta hydrolase [Methylomirabilota bacterium]|jgi:pimeloyl-ACP methyl ester carboxylesterase
MTTSPLGCKTARQRVIEANGVRLHFLDAGIAGAPVLLFLHGGAAHAHWFDAVTPAFSDRFHVISLDQRGHGQSDWPRPPAYSTKEFTADLVALLDAEGWDRVVLIGHSMGGHNALSFAAWHPERVQALVVVDSRPAIPDDRLTLMHQRGERPLRFHPTREAAVAAFRLLPRETVADRALLTHMAEEGVVKREAGWVYRFDPASNRDRQPVDAWALLHRIAATTLIVRGELSPVLPPPMAERMRNAIAKTTLVEIPGAYHHLVLDAPAAFADALDAFLAQVLAQV